MKDIYLDKSKSIDERVNDLLNKMTIDEKIDQMFTISCNNLSELLSRYEKGEIHNITATFIYNQKCDVDVYNKLQKLQLEKSRLKIPFILATENTHGVALPNATIFPTTGCISATFEPTLARDFAIFSAKEARAMGITQVYAPNIDISWDARWGRVEENFGEDPYLTSQMGKNVVLGFQSEGVCSTIKHYIAYGVPEGGLNLSPAHIGERDIREYMLEPFEECIKAGAWSLIPSYNEIDGEPVHASKYWMRDVLRDELKFSGVVMTDYGASNMLYDFHYLINEPVEAGKILCDNHIDLEACDYFGYNDKFRQLVKNGEYPLENVDKCVRNILTLKFRLGLFDFPFAYSENISKIHCKEHIEKAREIAEKGIVLLKNTGILPLSKEKKIAVIGPNGNISQLGDYISYGENKGDSVAENSLSLYQVLKNEGVNCEYSLGCEFHKTNECLLNDAIKVANNSDVIVLALGDNSKGGINGGVQKVDDGNITPELVVTSGEGYDLNKIELTDAQIKLFDTIKTLNKPIVMILYGGRPHAITEQVDFCSAILFGFGAGEQGNQAMSNILYGKVNPSGKLPLTFPRSTGHIPCFYNCKHSARGSLYQKPGSLDTPGRDYVFDSPNGLFPFGYGLSYTTFEYSNLIVNKIDSDNIKVSVSIKNTGKFDGDEVVLLYISPCKQKITPVVKKLRAFKRISLKVGQEKIVEFTLTSRDFSYVGVDMKKELSIGDNKIIIDKLISSVHIQ